MTNPSRPESDAALLGSVRRALAESAKGDLSPVKLAALVWSACTFIHRQGEVRELADWNPKPLRNFEQAARALQALADEPDATELYRTLLNVLVFLDDKIEPNTFDERSDGLVKLESLQPTPAILQGTVQVWVRQSSLLRRYRQAVRSQETAARADAAAGSGAEMRYEVEPDCSLGTLTFYLQSLERPRLSFRPSTIESDLRPWQPLTLDSAILATRGTLRIALCPLRGPWRPQFRIVEANPTENEGPRFVALPRIKEELDQAFILHLESILEEARRKEIHILVFPELSIDQHTREVLREHLRDATKPSPLLAVIAGSFHIGEPVPRNEAVVWDGSGRLLWAHSKRGRFRLDPWQMDLHETREFFPELHHTPGTPVWEGITLGSELVLVDTRLGRLTVLICADALEPEASYLELIGRAHPDLVIIVAMTPKTAQFEGARERLVKQGIGVLCVNAACVCQGGRRHLGEMVFVDLAVHESGDLPPTRWRWRTGREPEWYRYRRPAERRPENVVAGGQRHEEVTPWRALSELPQRDGEEGAVTLLDDEAGFVINLGSYLRGFGDEKS